MISSVPATCLLGFAVVWWPRFAGGVNLACHCAPSAQCPDIGHCPNGCENGWAGPGCQIGNLALRKSAWQSTTYTGDGIDNGAHMAVDGVTPNNDSAAHCSHTSDDNNADPWWYVEFDGKDTFVIQNVTIVNRIDCGRLANFSIVYTTSLINNPPDFTNWQTCVHVGERQRNLSQGYSCGGEAVAKRVGVRLRNLEADNLLTLCEVIVIGYKKHDCPIGYTGPGCLLRDCTSASCTDDCNSINGCYYLTCPNSAVLRTDCWIKIPSIKNLDMSTAVTCDSITVIADSLVDGVHHGTYSTWLELKYENNVTIYPLHTAFNVSGKFNLKMPALAGALYKYRMVFQWCSSHRSSCFFSNSSWRSVSTARRPCNRPLPCHCVGGLQCHLNGYCKSGCANGWFGPGCQVGNLALNKDATQNSVYTGDGVDNTAGMAVDGRNQAENRSRGAQYCSHTASTDDSDGWWYVELDKYQDVVIRDVTIYNRRHYTFRLSNFSIVYTSKLDSQQPDTNWSTCIYNSGVQLSTVFKYSCLSKAIGRKLGVVIRNPLYENTLTLCEVIVDGYFNIITECNDGFTGPGCLLHDCNTTNCSGGCDEYGGCKYSTCPDSVFLPPECWIRLPSLATVTLLPRAMCNSIYININSLSNDGDLNISSLIVEMTSDSPHKRAKKTKTVMAVLMGTIVYAESGTHYSVRLLPQWCNDSSGACFDGRGTSWINVTTKERLDTYSANATCFMLNVNNTISGCEEIMWQIQCVDRDAQRTVIQSNETFVCGLTAGINYACTARGFLDNIIVEKRIYNIPGPTEGQVPQNRSIPVTLIVGILSSALLCGVFVTIFILLLRRKQNDTKTKSSANTKYSVKNGIALHEPYATITTTTSGLGADNYAALSFPSGLPDHNNECTEDVYENLN